MTPSRPVRVAEVVTRMNVGGAARHVVVVATRMGTGFEETVLTGEADQREGSLLEEARMAGARIRPVPRLRRRLSPLNDLRAFVWLYRYFRRTRPQLVATHMAKAGALGRVAATLARVPIRVHTFHGHVLQGYFHPVLNTFFKTVERGLARLSTQLIAVSPEIAEDLRRMGIGRDKIAVVRYGFDLEPLTRARAGTLRTELRVDPGAQLVGIVGRLVPIKDHTLFLEAAELVRGRRPQTRFLIVGDGELWDTLHAQVAGRGLQDVVLFTGWRKDLAEVYGDLDVVVCCSINEGTPVSVIEAGAAGRPVVATRAGGMTDVVQDGVNGLLVASGDRAGLAQAIDRVLGDPELAQRMGEAGRKMALAQYGYQRMVDEVQRLYARLLESRQPVRMSA